MVDTVLAFPTVKVVVAQNVIRSGELAIVNYEGGSRQPDKPVARSFEEFLCEWFLEGWADEPA